MSKTCTALNAEEQAQALVLWDDGWSAGKVAAMMLVDHLTIKRLVLRSGREWEVRRGGKNHWNHGNGDGGHMPRPDGYVTVYVPGEWPWAKEMAYHDGGNKYLILEHRKVMAEKLGRALLRSETVHHKDGVRSNNHPDNLQLRSGAHGPGVLLQCNECGSHDVGPAPLED